MSDYYQTIVDCETTQDDAFQFANSITLWLIQRGIIQTALSDCILSENLGYAPGLCINEVLTDEDKHLRKLRVNGLEVSIGRVIGMPAEAWSGTWQLFCPNCGAKNSSDNVWSDALSEWYLMTDNGLLWCNTCKQGQIVTEWRYDPSWGFGNLGFTFWNWPPLKQTFIEDFKQILGHRIVYVSGKI